MGADMMSLMILTDQTKNYEDLIDAANTAFDQAWDAENDRTSFEAVASWVGVSPTNDLAAEVTWSLPDKREEWRSAVRDRYRESIAEVIEPFGGHRQVSVWQLGGLRAYITGGLPFGDSPTETFDVWEEFFRHEADAADLDIPHNPYAGIIWRAIAVTEEPWSRNVRPEYANALQPQEVPA